MLKCIYISIRRKIWIQTTTLLLHYSTNWSAISDEQADYLDSQDVRLALLNAPEVLKTLKVFSSRLMRVIYTLLGCALLENEKNPPQIAGIQKKQAVSKSHKRI